jgi:hypothetical protein
VARVLGARVWGEALLVVVVPRVRHLEGHVAALLPVLRLLALGLRLALRLLLVAPLDFLLLSRKQNGLGQLVAAGNFLGDLVGVAVLPEGVCAHLVAVMAVVLPRLRRVGRALRRQVLTS